VTLAARAAVAVEAKPVETASPRLELTARALVVGSVIGAILAAANVYTSLKISILDGGSITAALLGFLFFASFSRPGRRPYSALENNITQTTAASAAIMGFVAGAGGGVPAMAMLGRSFPGWALALWGLSIALFGVLAAVLLRRKLLLDEGLPFPTGNATGELIETMFAARHSALRRARFLLGGAIVAAAVTWFRDGKPQLIPASTAIGGAVGGLTLSTLSVELSWSPLLFSTGVMMGIRAGLSMALGAAIGWLGLAPWLVRTHLVREAGYAACAGWLVWPGLGLLMAGSFVPLILDWRSLVRAARDIGAVVSQAAGSRLRKRPSAGATAAVLGGLVALAVVWRGEFKLSLWALPVAVATALILSVVSSRAAGETDLAPSGPVGTLTQLLFSGYGPILSLLAGTIANGTSGQAAQTLWAFKAGSRLGSSARAQLLAQLLGALVGGLVLVPVYLVLTKAYGLGTERLPAPTAISWRATAEAVRNGLASLPPHATTSGVAGLLVGALLALGGSRRWGKHLPSPAAMGIAFLTPASVSLAVAAGALLAGGARRLRPSLDQESLISMAAGGMAGESIMGVIIAIALVTGLFK
jgi:uncharacterized oligopeptide transporter (OPT) family protein